MYVYIYICIQTMVGIGCSLFLEHKQLGHAHWKKPSSDLRGPAESRSYSWCVSWKKTQATQRKMSISDTSKESPHWSEKEKTCNLWQFNIANWKDPPFLMGKSTISTGPCSIAMSAITRPGNGCMYSLLKRWCLLWNDPHVPHVKGPLVSLKKFKSSSLLVLVLDIKVLLNIEFLQNSRRKRSQWLPVNQRNHR